MTLKKATYPKSASCRFIFSRWTFLQSVYIGEVFSKAVLLSFIVCQAYFSLYCIFYTADFTERTGSIFPDPSKNIHLLFSCIFYTENSCLFTVSVSYIFTGKWFLVQHRSPAGKDELSGNLSTPEKISEAGTLFPSWPVWRQTDLHWCGWKGPAQLPVDSFLDG